MSETATATAATEREIAAAYRLALNYARRQAGSRGTDAAEAFQDAATDGVMAAIGRYDPARSAGGFLPFAFAVVRTRVRRAVRNHVRRLHAAPAPGQLPDEIPARGPSTDGGPGGADLRDIPDELREAVRLVLIDGYTLRGAGEILGMDYTSVRRRLLKAAVHLAPAGAPVRVRPFKQKRLRGHAGH